ncbi:SET and MYND domain-containing protein 4 [Armadillidium nasatum]|uniref:SET and MYND domain-containing protein 4 n=1 Tax=Armadillidium nasatum TaxID=96803 RepID=A0A5N5TLL1_9CRUS|nr:SET and MYND domain-containing protein 4 [Armadillidium nasatum]
MDNASLRKLCSDVTLQSQKEGFFNQWADQVENLLTNDFFIQFSKLKSDKERFLQTWNNEHLIPSNIGEDLSLCFANRSAALFHCKDYNHCLQDIDLALSHGYPNRLKYKILERRGQCLAKFGRIKESQRAFEEAISTVQESDLNEGKKETWIQETLKKMSLIQSCQETLENDNNTEDDVYKEKLYKGQSKIFPRASSSLILKYTEETGRYMAASEDIPAVNILVRERPFSSVLMQEKRGTFCENCFKK